LVTRDRIGKQFGNQGRRQDDLVVAKVAPARIRLSGRAFAGLDALEEALGVVDPLLLPSSLAA
jgi:hypothetical protein